MQDAYEKAQKDVQMKAQTVTKSSTSTNVHHKTFTVMFAKLLIKKAAPEAHKRHKK